MARYKVLYVDDEEINLRVFKKTFRKDFEVLLAKSGMEAIDILQKQNVDIVITDQRMPKMTGTELLGRIQEMFPQIPPHRLMLSGYYDKDEIEKAIHEYHLQKFIQKPWSEDDMRESLEEVLHRNESI